MLPFSGLLPLAAIAVLVRLVLSAFSSWQHARKARQMGCRPAPIHPGDPFGISGLVSTVRYDREKLLPEMVEDRVATMAEIHDRVVSTYRVRLSFQDHLFTVDPKNIQAVLATQFKEFGLGSLRIKIFGPLLGHGIFTSDGEEWSHARALLRPQFTRSQVSDLDLEERHVRNAMQALPVGYDGWTSDTNIQAIFFRLTIDSATEFLFGKSCESQLAALHSNTGLGTNDFAYCFDRSQQFIAEKVRYEKMYWLFNREEDRRCQKVVHNFIDHYVESALRSARGKANNEKASSNDEKQSTPYVFLEALAASTQDPLELRAHLVHILLAGRDTTASLLSWAVLLLARHPEIQQKLRQVILDEFGTYTQPQKLTFAALKSCQYLQYCLNETLRLYPVVPFNRREALRDTTLPRGGGPDGLSPVFVRKGQNVLYNPHVMHRRKDIWGEDAAEFRPERWNARKVGWEYIPFNGGPRICIGQQFALTEAGYVLVRLLQRFDSIEDVAPQRRIRYNLTLTSCPADPVTVRMHEAVN
ncbi:hypothetical protein ASPZODRAFT_132621 [Penicilliopsis zonata CBS 506.65]|uniref:Cytochrome P450 n=1 Tax=Penicilliopsis zonata CBS 506.65 TaxID=1073090 RepID=A0A1L9SHN8_9EURO|nr:hypothetical protein ASPZODRAFT_132621 [Penicilliopsis zonata CBS 506.65]OJJ46554.1 hypothetical protein ASPZODRAFT_132621 [Penicilliopsis zonata CBS 506.65]